MELNRHFFKFTFFLFFYFFSSIVLANNQCSHHFINGKDPIITKKSMEKNTIKLCFEDFSTLNSKVTLTPLYAAEHITQKEIKDAKVIARYNAFSPDFRLPSFYRAELNDYKGSGFDRGHLAPAANMDSEESMRESFKLSNIVPQNPKHNRGIWSKIERATRNMALHYNEVYVVTGVAYGDKIERINQRVFIPGSLYKAVYIPSKNSAAAYWSDNNELEKWEAITLYELEKRAFIKPFGIHHISRDDPSVLFKP